MNLKLNSKLLLLTLYTSIEVFYTQKTDAQSPATTRRCVDFYVRQANVSPNTAFAFCENSAETKNPTSVVACTRHYSRAGVSPDHAFQYCGNSAGTENAGRVIDCLKFFGGSGVSPDNAFKRCVKEAR